MNVTVYEAVNMIHESLQLTAKFIFVGVTNNKTQQVRC